MKVVSTTYIATYPPNNKQSIKNIGDISAQLGDAMILNMVPWQHWKVWEERNHMPQTGTLVENVFTIKSKNRNCCFNFSNVLVPWQKKKVFWTERTVLKSFNQSSGSRL